MPKVIKIIAPDGDNLIFMGQSLNDTIVAGNGIQTLYGNAGDDLLVAGNGNQFLYGGSGNDTIVAGAGNQVFDGGSGIDTLDFSRVDGRFVIDQDLHYAKIVDAVTGVVLFTDSVTSFNKIIGANAGSEFFAAANTSNIYVGGAGNDLYHSENGGDTVTGGTGSDTFGWFRKYAEVGRADHITDFQVGTDTLDLRDFLKGQTIKSPAYSDVIQLLDTVDASGSHGTLVQGLVNGLWHDIAVLDGMDVQHVTVDALARL